MVKGRFGLLFIDEEGQVFPAYPKDSEGREMVDSTVKMGMFGEDILVDRKTPIGMLNKKLKDIRELEKENK